MSQQRPTPLTVTSTTVTRDPATPPSTDNPVLDDADALHLSAIVNRAVDVLSSLELSTDEALVLNHLLYRARDALWDKHGDELLPYFDGSILDDDSERVEPSGEHAMADIEDQLDWPF